MGAPDPFPYEGPIAAADGTRPWNHYLWPTESWWISHEPEFRGFPGLFHFGYVALMDGRFSTDGEVYSIEQDCNCDGQRCLFATRAAAIRASAARMIRAMRGMARHESPYMLTSLSREHMQRGVNWVRAKVAEICGQPAPEPRRVPIVSEELPEGQLNLFETRKAVACE